jgi:hypothetical protein
MPGCICLFTQQIFVVHLLLGAWDRVTYAKSRQSICIKWDRAGQCEGASVRSGQHTNWQDGPSDRRQMVGWRWGMWGGEKELRNIHNEAGDCLGPSSMEIPELYGFAHAPPV